MIGPEASERTDRHAGHERAAGGDDSAASASRGAGATRPRRPRPLGPVTQALVIGVWVWSLVVIPWELHGAGLAQMLALLFSKALLTVLVFCTLRGVRGARVVFTFVCAISVVAIGFDLPIEYTVLRTGFYLSVVDSAVKLAAAVALASRYATR